jgi:hypothetical protein
MTAAPVPPAQERSLVAIVRGGLGNQLFIYAMARAMALRTGRTLYLDTVRGYQADDFGRSFRLDRFSVAASVMPEALRIAPTLKHPRHKFIRAINKVLPVAWRSYLAEREDTPADFVRRFDSQRRCVTLLGYWQDERFFADVAAALQSELAPPEPANEQVLVQGARFASAESVFLHVRRTRYSPLLGAGYYQSAIDQAHATLTNPLFIVFGDDLAWVKSSLDFRGAATDFQTYAENDELTDLWLMTQCRHAIVANSSFSWWAAWLGRAANRKIWAPASTGLPLVMPPDWIRVSPHFDEKAGVAA